MSSLRPVLIALALVSGLTATAQASIQARWPLLAFAQESGCELQVRGNGQVTELRATGLIPGEALNFTLTNGDMKPLDWQVHADRSGGWSQLYLPFRFGQTGGNVRANIAASRCTMSASFRWTRLVRTIP